ncbi:MAG: lasso RiPP family leader peptide-containing protein [Pseudonocardiaceae bacterium]
MDGITDEVMIEKVDYEAPAVIELGSLVDVTNGSGANDTADMKRWYN